jgi:haloalkane dehalogenase
MLNDDNLDIFPYPANYINVGGTSMSYIEAGQGDTILFLHGVPTSSFLWRNIIPHLATLGRCIAPDLIGFGRSAKPHIAYSVDEHLAYLEQFIAEMNLKNITFIMHGFGSLLGFHYAMQHEKNCKGLVFYESFLHSMRQEYLSLPFQEQIISLNNKHKLEKDNHYELTFVDTMISQACIHPIAKEIMQQYRQPFLQAGATLPVVSYLNALSKDQADNKIDSLITAYSNQLTRSLLPKLMLYSTPGFITTMETVMWAKAHLPNLELIDIGEELHLAQETCPQLIGEAISVWLQAIEQDNTRVRI